MFRVDIHINIRRIIAIFHWVGLWHRHDEETVGQRGLKLFYLIFYSLLPVSLMAGAVASDNKDEKVFLVEGVIISAVLLIKLWVMIRKKKEIFEFLEQICEYRIDDLETYTVINDKVQTFMKFVNIFLRLVYFVIALALFVAPFIGTERKLFVSIGFPLDWRNDEFAYWMASTFIIFQSAISVIVHLFSVIIWYTLANCSWRYEVLGDQMIKMGEVQVAVNGAGNNERKISNAERDNLYLRDLVGAIKSHNYLKELTNNLDIFLSKILAAHLTTSALCLCASIYSIAISKGDNFVELYIYFGILLYNIFEIFMLTYFGNEIKLASDKLSYHLYESNWVDRSQSIKKNILIFGEFLMQPHQLFIWKIYPLTLETFTRILNSAYNMFNILKSLE